MTLHLKDLARVSRDTLTFLFERGTTPRWEDLKDAEFLGANLWLPAVLSGNQKFKKGFFERDGIAMGYNVRVQQNGLDAPWRALPSDRAPKRFGFYIVSPVEAQGPESRHTNALLLHYGKGGNGAFGPPLRDYLVQIDPENRDVFLGAAYFAFGTSGTSLPLPPVYFVLERDIQGMTRQADANAAVEKQPMAHSG